MGNWRRIQIIGTCPAGEVEALRARIDARTVFDHFGPLSYCGGLCGLPLWPAEQINVVGNCAERDYTPEDIAKHLSELLMISPGLRVKIHCGGDYEAQECIATVNVAVVALVGRGEIEKLADIPEDQIAQNFLSQITRRRPI